MHGVAEFCEVFYDDVRVPADRLLGDVNGGWSIAMDLLPYERSTALWHRSAYLQRRLGQLVAAARARDARRRRRSARRRSSSGPSGPSSRATQRRLAAGETLGPETSVDKVLVATAEQVVFDLVAEATRDAEIALGDDPVDRALARPSSSTRGRRRSTAAAPRYSATSLPVGCSTSETTGDGGGRAAPSSSAGSGAPPRPRPTRRSMRPWTTWAGATRWKPTASTAVSVLFEAQGAANATSSALGVLLATRAGPGG